MKLSEEGVIILYKRTNDNKAEFDREVTNEVAQLEDENEKLQIQIYLMEEALQDAKQDIETSIYNEDGLDGAVGSKTLLKINDALKAGDE